MKRQLFAATGLMLFVIGIHTAAAQTENVRRWSVLEMVLNSRTHYANPYTDVEITAEFTGPGNVRKIVRGFWDGGWTFKIRFTPTIKGKWTYSVRSIPADTGLAKSGGFEAGGPPAGCHGFLRRDLRHPYHFIYDDGTRFFLFGQTYYNLLGRTEANWKASIDGTASRGINKIRMYVEPEQLDKKTKSLPVFNRSTPDLERYRKFDRIIEYMLTGGIIADLIVFDDNFGTQDEDERFLRYVLARYAAYPNVVWTLVNEWNYRPKPRNYWNVMGQIVRCEDPWMEEAGFFRPLSTHQQTRINFQFFDQSWPVHAIIQYGVRNKDKDLDDEWKNTGKTKYRHGDEWGNAGILFNRGHAMPVVNDEYGYIGEPRDESAVPVDTLTRIKHRNIIWGIYIAGGYGSAGDKYTYEDGAPYGASSKTGWHDPAEYQDIQRLVKFFTTKGLAYWKMSSQNGLIRSGNRVYLLAEPGRQYVAYAAAEGTFSVKVAPGTYRAKRFDPRTGEETVLPSLKGGVRTFSLPDAQDWVVYWVSTGDPDASRKRIVLNDPLSGKTSGKAEGGRFVQGGGWTPAGPKDRIVWELPEAMGDGCLEIDIRNFDPPKQAKVQKSNFLGMWETLWKNGDDQGNPNRDQWGLRIGSNYPQFKLKIHTHDACRYEKSLAPIEGGFDPNHTYRFKAEWKEGRIVFSIDGREYLAWDSPVADPIDRFKYIHIGSDTQFDAGEGSAVAGPIYSNLRIMAY